MTIPIPSDPDAAMTLALVAFAVALAGLGALGWLAGRSPRRRTAWRRATWAERRGWTWGWGDEG